MKIYAIVVRNKETKKILSAPVLTCSKETANEIHKAWRWENTYESKIYIYNVKTQGINFNEYSEPINQEELP